VKKVAVELGGKNPNIVFADTDLETVVDNALTAVFLHSGGRRPDDPELKSGFFYRPTVLADCSAAMTVVREETFGPILTVERFTSEEEAAALGNDTDFGLAGAVWTEHGAGAGALVHPLTAQAPTTLRPAGAAIQPATCLTQDMSDSTRPSAWAWSASAASAPTSVPASSLPASEKENA
jgi:acyl-CoA reductase-like NAD-dependent aldehyde dehydrogenase